MRIYSFVLCTFLCTAGTAMAQPAVFGVKAGINLATVTFDPEPDEDVLDRRTGFVGGLFVVVPASDRLGFQGEVLFSQKGASEDGGAGDLALDYLEVPLLLRVGTASPLETSFHAFAGPSIGLRLRARFTTETFDGETEDEDIADDVKGFDFGVVAGAGVNFGRFTLDARYTWGLNNLNSLEDDEMKLRNRVFSIMAGVRFWSRTPPVWAHPTPSTCLSLRPDTQESNMHPFKKSWLSQSVATFKSRRRASALALLVLACACGGKSAAPTQPSTAQVSGAWRIGVRLNSVTGGECASSFFQSRSDV